MDIEPFPTAPGSVLHTTTPMHSRFAMPHALVIATCIITAAILVLRDMAIADVLLLIGGAGGIGAAIVTSVMAGKEHVSRIDRFMRAYRSSSN
ncbi:hypothetical protein [Streptomyces sp. NPDC059272]|uniref:hypothetical protein n=1 Tax=Streptomyces sp. NPDC059272 TaxID=3346800 RepID=UPI0036B4CDC6